MLDFNTKKEILRKLQKKGAKNLIMRVLCAIAALFVKIWYGIGCRISMGLSDKNGNLLGIKGLGSRAGRKKKARREDDIVYVKKPFLGRVLSAVLAVSFIFMVAPELDLFDLVIRASAADPNISDTITVYIDGKQVPMYRDLDKSDKVEDGVVGNHYLVRKTDYDNANKATVEFDKFYVGYENVRISWHLNPTDEKNINDSEQRMELTGYWVEIYQDGILVNNDGKGELVGSQRNYIQCTLPSAKGAVYAIVRPVINIKEYLYEGSMDSATVANASINLTEKVKMEIYGTRKTNIEPASAPSANATLSIPVVTVNEGNEDAYSRSIKITWTKSSQDGGNEKDAHATGYVIYRKEGNNNFKELYTFVDKNGDMTREYTDKSVENGIHYQYFVEAFRYAWDYDDNIEKFNPNSKAIITSSGSNTKDSAENKASLVYNSYIKDVYIAPATPNLDVKPTPGKNVISLSWGASRGDYTGVILYRTKGEDSELDPDVLKREGKMGADEHFGDWIKTNVGNYGIERIYEFGKNENSYDDSAIVAGETYWYYAVPYLEKDGGGRLYGDARRRSSKLIVSVKPPTALIPTKGDGETTLKWDTVTNAQGYEIAIKKISSQDFSNEGLPWEDYDIIDVGNTTTYLHRFLYNGDTYEYMVRSYIDMPALTNEGEESRVYSDWTRPIQVTVGLPFPAPQNVNATTVDGQVTVKWEAVSGAAGYTLYYKEITAGEHIDVNSPNFVEFTDTFDVGPTTYTHTNLLNGKRYAYYVRAYKSIPGNGLYGTQKVYSDRSNAVTIKVGQPLNIPQGITVTTKDGETTVKWDSVDGAEGYILEYRKLPGQSWDFDESTNKGRDGRSLDLGSKTTYNHTRLQNGDVYEYRVRAYKTVSGERVYSDTSVEVSITVGDVLDAPKDFIVTTTDGVANLKWTAVKGAEGYIITATSGSRRYQYDVSKTEFTHTGLINGETWTYSLVAYKTVNGSRVFSNPPIDRTIIVGISMAAAVDLTATAGNRRVDLSWTAVTGAEGYVVYLYNEITMEYEPIAVTSKPSYTHLGLKNGIGYTYMVAAFKTSNGTRVYGEYSMPVTAIPTTGSPTDIDRNLTIKGTAPYGISHGEYISAGANHGAFDESVDVYFTTSEDATNAVRDVLKNYANGLSSFIIYPFDISIYKENTLIEVSPNPGYSVTITMPIPDRLVAYRDYITIVHINENADEEYITDLDWLDFTDRRLEVLPCAILEIDDIWCLQFECTSFSPYAIVIYKDHISDISSGEGVMDGIFAGNFNSGVLLFTALPDILPNNRKLRIVSGGKKRYRIKSIEKRNV